ncbi:uncharacterized protein LOC127253666 isoform X2 [Andrographis paniculata]|uniref:uncharacterized protein LOC127253666 isoform X2 n=1 Tax=Andrographis paniculata TaxID=175694 RepID=UPI0021E75A2C|nr:uncharacterized protein LOC127253666 isoform X2 [Andrographis paniculata]
MSGGFFRGTSADQDTRFSNKQAKLLKSQKFPPELENLVDMTKVKMDIMRPWIAKRVTELIGFEDEVLINFIYSLLEGKAVNGKEVQISLTGFMERNTGKFMKELWSLLLSAQQNVTGIPQQFLDVKEEETKKKKAETDRIASEINRNKEREKQELEMERRKTGGEDSFSTDKHTELEIGAKHNSRESSILPADDKERIKRNGRRQRGSHSPDSAYHSQSPRRKHSASPSKSSNSRSYSNERGRSRSNSGAPTSRSRSISLERHRRRGRDRSVTPIRRHNVRRSPSPKHASFYSRRRSTSHSRHRSPSPVRYRPRSPLRRRSRSPIRRRSRTPVRGRSPSHVRRRSRTPLRRSPARLRSRTPLRRRSPSPIRRRSPSPIRRKSPYRRSRSPGNYSSPSPVHRRIASPMRRGSPPSRRQPSPSRRRYHRSPSTPPRRSVSPARGRSSLRGRKKSFSPAHRKSTPEGSSSPSLDRRGSLSPIERGSLKTVRSSMESPRGKTRRGAYSPVQGASDKKEELPMDSQRGVKSVESKPVISLRSPQRDMLDQDDLHEKNHDLSASRYKSSLVSHVSRSRSYSDDRRSTSPHGNDEIDAPGTKSRTTQLRNSDTVSNKMDDDDNDGARVTAKKISQEDDGKGTRQYSQQETSHKPRNFRENDQNGSRDSPSKEANESRGKIKEKQKRRKSDSQEMESDDYSSSDSYEDRKEAKRKRKEEKKLKKEKKRRRREERRRRREETRAEKIKLKSGDSDDSSSPDRGRRHPEEKHVKLQAEAQLDQKKLEIELREKALETLRAKKGLGN